MKGFTNLTRTTSTRATDARDTIKVARRSRKLREAMTHLGRESDPRAYLEAVLTGVIDPKTGRRREAS